MNHAIINTLHLPVSFLLLPLTVFSFPAYQVTTVLNFANFITIDFLKTS